MKYRFLSVIILMLCLYCACTNEAAYSERAAEIDELFASEDEVSPSDSCTFPSEVHLDDTVYIGEYLDPYVEDPNLEIAKGDDGKYIVQIVINRLTSLSDGIGELTVDGMKFSSTDASGNPIHGLITVENQTATVTFTSSTWDYLPNGSDFKYTKSSNVPNIRSE